MTIYLDAVWALNFFLDLMLLMLTQAIAKDNTKKIRLIFGAFIASLIVPLSLFYPESFFTSVSGKLLYSICIILCSFKMSSFYKGLKLLLWFYFTTFVIGGGLIAVHFLFQNQFSISKTGILTINSGYGDPISWLFILIGFPFIWIFTKRRMDKHAAEKIRYELQYKVVIELKNKAFMTTGFIDSGNQLVDPVSRRPVVICDEVFLKQWFSKEDWELMKQAHGSLDFSKIPEAWEKLIHIVPFQGVEGKSNFLMAIRPDKLTLYYNNDIIVVNKVLIGIQFARLTKDESYHCLLQPQLIKLGKLESA